MTRVLCWLSLISTCPPVLTSRKRYNTHPTLSVQINSRCTTFVRLSDKAVLLQQDFKAELGRQRQLLIVTCFRLGRCPAPFRTPIGSGGLSTLRQNETISFLSSLRYEISEL